MNRIFLSAVAAASCAAGAAAQTPLIPRDVFFDNPQRAGLQVSPGGDKISFLAPVDGVLNVWVAPADAPADARPVTKDDHRGIRQYFWAYTNDHILYLQDKGGDEDFQLFSVNLDTLEEKLLTPFDSIAGPDGQPMQGVDGKQLRPTVQVQRVSDKFPKVILIGLNLRSPYFHDLYRVDIETGDLTQVIENEGFVGFMTDDDYNVPVALAFTPQGGIAILKRDADQWAPLIEAGPMDSLSTTPVDLTKDAKAMYLIDSRDRDTSALTRVELATGDQTIIYSSDRADISNLMMHPTEHTIEAVATEYDRTHWTVIDDAVADDIAFLDTVTDGDWQVTSRSHDDTTWTLAYVMDDGPVRYYLYDRPAKKATFLFTNRPSLEGLPLAKMHPVVIKSRDGLDLVSYLTVPVASDPDVDARPDAPLPMVLLVHGGPWARDSWGYSGYHQWLANRGYAVLSVNFRGSTGFGKDFINAADAEWSGKMHDDLIDAVDWAIKEGIADEDRVAIMGGSYGGYATLVGLTFTPEKFACGVDIVGPSSLITLLRNIPEYWRPFLPVLTTRVGDPDTEEGRKYLESISPLTYVDKIVKPLLIGQGARDPRVKQVEADQIVEAMKERHIPVTYVLFPDEGHGFQRPENGTAFNAVTEVFLAEHLGGRYQPIDDDLEGSSIEVPEGAGQVQGLTGALESNK